MLAQRNSRLALLPDNYCFVTRPCSLDLSDVYETVFHVNGRNNWAAITPYQYACPGGTVAKKPVSPTERKNSDMRAASSIERTPIANTLSGINPLRLDNPTLDGSENGPQIEFHRRHSRIIDAIQEAPMVNRVEVHLGIAADDSAAGHSGVWHCHTSRPYRLYCPNQTAVLLPGKILVLNGVGKVGVDAADAEVGEI